MPRQYIDPQPFKDKIAALEKENAELKSKLAPSSEGLAPAVVKLSQARPTIAELEAILNSEEDLQVVVNPDGSVSAIPKDESGATQSQAVIDSPVKQGRADWPVHSTGGPGVQIPVAPTPIDAPKEAIEEKPADAPPSEPFGGIDKFADEHRAHPRELTKEQ